MSATSPTKLPPAPVSDAFFRELFDHAGVALIATDEELRIRGWNGAAARIFGAAAETMIGVSADSIVPSEQRGIARRLLTRAVEHGEISDLEFQYRDERGGSRALIVTVSPISSAAGRRVGASACIRDITRRIRLQEEILQHRKRAALGQMAGAVAHFFNNILGGITTSVDFAASSEDPEYQTSVLRRTGAALSRATAILRALLRVAEGDRQSDDLSDYTELVFTLADELEPRLQQQGIELTIDLPQLPVLPVSRTSFRTVLQNVLDNAVEAMPNGGTLTIAATLEDGTLTTRIRDTGCGMDEETRSRMFEPFWTTKGTHGGGSGGATGLGLSVALGIVGVMGGSITAESEPGEGSTFTVRIPSPDVK